MKLKFAIVSFLIRIVCLQFCTQQKTGLLMSFLTNNFIRGHVTCKRKKIEKFIILSVMKKSVSVGKSNSQDRENAAHGQKKRFFSPEFSQLSVCVCRN